MQLAIVHFHLNPGGVAKVVQNHLLALAEVGDANRVDRVLLVYGGRARDWPHEELAARLPFPVEMLVVDGLDYDAPDATVDRELARRMEQQLAGAGYAPDDTLLHWHNHALGKNVSAPLAVSRLAAHGFRTLLQIHDFAEDFRPANYRKLLTALADGQAGRLPELLYPQGSQIHYASLNRRDHRVLSATGIASERIHLLPNPVAAPDVFADAGAARELIVDTFGLPTNDHFSAYPVRGIRRKNLGELALWSAVAERSRFHVTLAPQNPVERVSFDRWKKFAAENHLPCFFGPPESSELTFDKLLAGSDALVTTSIAEGFGMVFLEAWLAGKRLLGRNLPEITSDFTEAGLDLEDLYRQLAVPTDWLDRQRLVEELETIVGYLYQSYGLAAPSSATLDRQLADLLTGPTVDFALLPVTVQREVIARVATQRADRGRLLDLNPKLQPTASGSDAKIAANAAVVGEHYSLSALGEKLANVYARLSAIQPDQTLAPIPHGNVVLDTMLRVERLHPVRVQP